MPSLQQIARIPHFRGLLSFDDGSVIGFRRRFLVRFAPPFKTPTVLGRLPAVNALWELSRSIARLSRNTPYRLVRLDSGTFITIKPGGIHRLGADELSFRSVFRDFAGRRPISLCRDRHNNVYFGEYFANPLRGAVRIFMSSDDGLTWQACHEFPPGEVRHVHGLEYDTHQDRIWVLCGDDGDEAQIGIAEPGFGSFAVLLQKDQLTRAVSGVCTDQGFFYGTDAPDDQNSICRIPPDRTVLETLQPVQHSVFFCGAACEGMFFSTVVEPSQTNRARDVHIWYSSNGEQWHDLLHIRRDSLSLSWFQYPSCHIAQGPRVCPYVFLSFSGAKRWDGCCFVGEIQ